ncbi:MAG: DUF2149 domain-containing protein [Actinobacteria bacterium]|nr:MAG: DUF2149 domain-containing protein [Actinomycetota bacterium]
MIGRARRIGDANSFMERHRTRIPDRNGDPMEAVANLFDVAMLIGIGFLVVALSSFGLKELLTSEDLTIVKSPGTPQMEIITRTGDTVERFTTTPEEASGQGLPIGTVYRLENGQIVWVPR